MDELKKLRELTEVLTGNGYLRNQAEEWEYALDAIPEFVYVIDTNHNLKFVNKTLAERLGKSKEELRNEKCYVIIKGRPTHDDDTCVFPLDCCDLKEDIEAKGEVFLEKLNGWFMYDRSPIYTKSRKLIGFICILRDITERKQAESELLLKNIVFDTSIVANSIAGLDGVITQANESFANMWGYKSKDEIIGHHISYFIQDEAEAITILNALDETGEWVGEFTARKKDGSTFITNANSTILYDEAGKKVGYQSSVQDITERKDTEVALQESEERYRQIFNIAPAGIYELDYRKGKIVAVNDAVCEYSGYTKEELLEMTPSDLLTPESQEVFLKRLEKIAGGEEVPNTIDYEMITRDGKRIWLNLSNRHIYENNQLIGATVVARDITRRKTIEQNTKNELKEFINKVDKSKRILIVEDQSVVAEILAEHLKTLGFDPVIAEDGNRAVELIDENGICLVMVDLSLPVGPSGHDVIEKVVAHNCTVPIIVVSGTASVVDIDHAMRAGAWDYLIIPVNIDDLTKSIKTNLRQSILIKKSKLLDEFFELTN